MTSKDTPHLIALYSSAPQSGKSTVASALKNKGYLVRKFASPLKDMVDRLLFSLGYSSDTRWEMLDGYLKGELIPELGKTTRELLQTLGTDWGRNLVHEDLWAKCFAGALPKHSYVVCDDMRFPNEYDTMKSLGAYFVRINRPGIQAPNGHSSEGQLDGHHFDLVIENDSDINSLVKKVYEQILYR